MPRGDVVEVALPPPAGGHEQAGRRFAVIVQQDDVRATEPLIVMVPTTTNDRAPFFRYAVHLSPSPANGLTVDCTALVGQLRALDRQRILRTVGRLEPATLAKIDAN